MTKKKVAEECPAGKAVFARKCEGKVCCQAVTKDGEQCKRSASYQMDLTRGIKVVGMKVCPSVGCCFLCTQHLKQVAYTGITNLVSHAAKMWATKDFDYDQYYALFPNELPK